MRVKPHRVVEVATPEVITAEMMLQHNEVQVETTMVLEVITGTTIIEEAITEETHLVKMNVLGVEISLISE